MIFLDYRPTNVLIHVTTDSDRGQGDTQHLQSMSKSNTLGTPIPPPMEMSFLFRDVELVNGLHGPPNPSSPFIFWIKVRE